jgi:hypothetical protein
MIASLGTIRKAFFNRGELRLLSLQHTQGRVERTKDTEENRMKKASFWFCGKAITKRKKPFK